MIVDFTGWRQRFERAEARVEDYVDELFSRYRTVEEEVHAFVEVNWDAARDAAKKATVRYFNNGSLSAIDGALIGVKDIIETVQFPTQMQSPIYSGFHSRRNAECVSDLILRGGIVLGKTVTQELACGMPGPTRNPHDYNRTPGGSSSGSAAAVAAGMVPFALGTQTRASTIRPASFCGVYAIKPTYGQLSVAGIHPVAPSHDTLGLFAASLRDLATFYESLSHRELRHSSSSKRRLLAIRTPGAKLLESDVEQLFLEASRNARGFVVDGWDSLAAQEFDRLTSGADDLLYNIMSYEAQWPYGGYVSTAPELVCDEIRKLVKHGTTVSAANYQSFIEEKRAICAAATSLLKDYDAFISLSSAGVAPTGLDNTGSRSFAIPWSLVGGPSISLPLLSLGGLPIGLQIMGAPASEAICFEIAELLSLDLSETSNSCSVS